MKAWLCVLPVFLLVPIAHGKDNLCVNGSFEAKDDSLQGWNCDYAWTGNENYADNYTRVSVAEREGVRKKVLRLAATGVLETKVESTPIPYDPNYTYRCTLYAKGGPARIYLSAYKWNPGVRPHESPVLGELRPIYRCKTYKGSPSNWTKVELELSMKDASRTGRSYLSKVRFFTVYIFSLGELFIDDVQVEKSP